MLLFSHPTGNANVRAAIQGFHEAGLLREFNTTIASFPGSLLDRLSTFGPFKEISRRQFQPEIKGITKTFPWYEAGRLISLKAKLATFTRHETGRFCIDEVYRKHDSFVKERLKQLDGTIKAVYAYEDGCEASFRQAKKSAIKCLYDLPIGHWRSSQQILENERKRWPGWASTLVGVKNSAEKLRRKDNELRLADHIFVASSFTAKTLQQFPEQLENVHVIPYGFPPVFAEREYEAAGNRKLKLLFVGGLSQRKGIADLFHVCEKFSDEVALTVVGNKPSQHCEPLDRALAKCRWIPSLPHQGILSLMREHDIFVFPSVFEGFGLVITEAMSQGTPVITTGNTAGADLIRNGENGWLIEAGCTDSLQQALTAIVSAPEQLSHAGRNAMKTAAARPWSFYGTELSRTVAAFLAKRN